VPTGIARASRVRARGAALGAALAAPLSAAAAPASAGAAWPLLAGAAVFGAALALAAIAWVEHLRAQRERRAQAAAEAQLRNALQAAADFTWQADAGGRIESIAPTGARALPAGVDAATLRGRALWQLADAAAPCPPELQRALAARAPITDVVLRLPGGAAQEGAPWLLAGVPAGAGYVGIGRNLAPLAAALTDAQDSAAQAAEIGRLQAEADRLRGEAAERERQHALATRELESFAHSVSHDLRAPLRVVDGFATILLEDYAQPGKAIDDLGQEHIRRIIGAGTRMNAMIDTLLALSRMTSRDLERERVNLSQLARELADELKAGDRSRVVQFSIAPDMVTDGDRTLLRLVLQNLIGNAFKFTGRVAVAKIEVGTASDARGVRIFHVKDNGAGFDPRFADKMFGLFQRFHSANEFPGTGVGLATVQRIVRKHRGRIWAESQPGEGATFYFTLWE
jgi:signal transduction histidine kinase